jgi:tRNA wybutosine-synthesizing protein 4
MARYPFHCSGVKFIDVDYKDLMIKKRDTVSRTLELSSLLSNVETQDGDVLLCSDQYFQVGCDLRDLQRLSKILASILEIEKCIVLLVAEVSITYMDVEAADRLIKWAGELPDGKSYS